MKRPRGKQRRLVEMGHACCRRLRQSRDPIRKGIFEQAYPSRQISSWMQSMKSIRKQARLLRVQSTTAQNRFIRQHPRNANCPPPPFSKGAGQACTRFSRPITYSTTIESGLAVVSGNINMDSSTLEYTGASARRPNRLKLQSLTHTELSR